MATIQGQIDRLTAIERRLNGGAINAVTIAGADMAAAIANRVIETGVAAAGDKFTPYSPIKFPAYLYVSKALNAVGEAKTRAAAKRKEGISWGTFRTYNGRQKAYKNFAFSLEMWRNFGVKSVTYSGGIYTLTLGGKTKASADKIGWMSAQEKRSIIAANRVEKGRAGESLLKYAING